MSKKFSAKSIALTAGASFAISLAASPAAMADSNPFSMTKVSGESNIQLASGKCGEGKCGGSMKGMDKKSEGKCGEGKCGGNMDNKMKDGKCGGDMDKSKDKGKGMSEGKCGEGKCGGNK